MNLYLRFFVNILKNLLFPKPLDVFSQSSLKMRVLPNDLDANLHMNNGRFLTLMDIGRSDFTMRVGLHKAMLREKWGAVATAINVVYLRPLKVFDQYELRTKLLSWDDMWFYMEQRFVKDGMIVASAVVKATFVKGNKRIAPQQVIEKTVPHIPQAPDFPDYLKELVEGEDAFIKRLKEHNKKARKG